MSTKCASFAEVISYRNEDVVLRFCDDFGVSQEDASDIFVETLKWLWLCAHQIQVQKEQGREIVPVPLLSESFVIDLMWHNFILFTQDYANFCQAHFGIFIHHVPQTRATKNKLTLEVREKIVRDACELIYDTLGADTLGKWMEEFPERFSFLSKGGISVKHEPNNLV